MPKPFTNQYVFNQVLSSDGNALRVSGNGEPYSAVPLTIQDVLNAVFDEQNNRLRLAGG